MSEREVYIEVNYTNGEGHHLTLVQVTAEATDSDAEVVATLAAVYAQHDLYPELRVLSESEVLQEKGKLALKLFPTWDKLVKEDILEPYYQTYRN